MNKEELDMRGFFFFCNDFKPLEDMEEGDHINAELWAASNGEEGGLTKRFTKYNHETDNHDPQFELGMMFSDCHLFRNEVKAHCLSMRMMCILREMRYRFAVRKTHAHNMYMYLLRVL